MPADCGLKNILQRELATQPWKKDLRTVTGIKKRQLRVRLKTENQGAKQRVAPLDMV